MTRLLSKQALLTATVFLFLISFFSFLATPSVANAQGLLPDCDPVPRSNNSSGGSGSNTTGTDSGSDGLVNTGSGNDTLNAALSGNSAATGQSRPTCTFEHLIQLLVNIYNFALGLAAFIAMAFIIFGGIRMIGWAMLENPQEELLAGKRTVLRAMVGFIIILTAYLTVNTVLTLLGIDDSSQVGQLLNQFGF